MCDRVIISFRAPYVKTGHTKETYRVEQRTYKLFSEEIQEHHILKKNIPKHNAKVGQKRLSPGQYWMAQWTEGRRRKRKGYHHEDFEAQKSGIWRVFPGSRLTTTQRAVTFMFPSGDDMSEKPKDQRDGPSYSTLSMRGQNLLLCLTGSLVNLVNWDTDMPFLK